MAIDHRLGTIGLGALYVTINDTSKCLVYWFLLFFYFYKALKCITVSMEYILESVQ